MTVVDVTDATLKGTVTGPTFTGNVDGAKFTGSVTYANPPPVQTAVSLFTTQKPALLNASDGASVTYELGVKFKSTSAGNITALRFWKSDKETTGHTGHLWSATGSKLASVTFANETASGWQVATLGTPLSIAANTTYVASVGTSNSYFSTTENALTSSVSNPPLSTIVGNNGVYGPRGACPSQPSRNNNYFRDVLFVAGSTPPPQPLSDWPDASNTGPVAGTTLAPYTGSMNITTPGTTIENKTLNGQLTISAANVTVRNCVIVADATCCINSDQTPITVQNCKLVGGDRNDNGILGNGSFANNDISHVRIGIQCTSGPSTVRDNYIHDLVNTGPDPHFDAVTVLGGQHHVIIEHNSMSAPAAGGTSCILTANTFGPLDDILINNNKLLGQPSYITYFTNCTNARFTNNYIERGAYGYLWIDNANPTVTGNYAWNNGNPTPLTWPF